jgi:N-glycosylase/DNA lyase
MAKLLRTVKTLESGSVGNIVGKRLREFASFKDKPADEWFSELCFCLLAANSRQKTAASIQNELGPKGFCNCSWAEIRDCIRRHKHRFHNNKSSYVVLARLHTDIKQKVQDMVKKNGQPLAREWLVKNIKGLGFKEASHFLRNVGYNDLAILDRHIINVMAEHGLIQKPKTLNRKIYLEIEARLADLAKAAKMTLGELDLYMWYMKTGEVLK